MNYPNVHIYLSEYPVTDSYHGYCNSLNSHIHIHSRLRSGETITITQEQVTNRDQIMTFRLHINPNEDVLAMTTMPKHKQPGTVERAMGLNKSTAV